MSDTYQKLYESLKSRNEELERENSILKSEIATLQAEKVQWDQAKITQQLIIKQHLLDNDHKVQKLQQEIIELKTKYGIKE